MKTITFLLAMLLTVAVYAQPAPPVVRGVTTTNQIQPSAITVYVDPNGNDSTGVRGFFYLPFKTIEAASSNALAGDTIYLAPGIYNVSNTVSVPTNGAIVGRGPVSTTVNWWNTNASPTTDPCFHLTDNSLVANLTINQSGSFGLNNVYQSALGCSAASSRFPSPFTNAVIQNLVMNGETDVIFVNQQGPNYGCSLQVISCIATSHWDCIALQYGTHNVDIYDSQFNCHTNSYGATGNRSSYISTLTYSGRTRSYRTKVYCPDYDTLILRSTDTSTATHEFYGCTFTNTRSIAFGVGNGAKLTIDSACTGWNANQIDDGGTGLLTVSIPTAPIQNIMFVGEAASATTPPGLYSIYPTDNVLRGTNMSLAIDGTYTGNATNMTNFGNFELLRQPRYRRFSMVQASGAGAGTLMTVVGDSYTTVDTSTISQAPTANAGTMRVGQTSATSDAGFSGNLNYRFGRNVYYNCRQGFAALSPSYNWYNCASDQTLPTMGASTNAAGNYLGFLAATNQSNWLCISKDNATQQFFLTSVSLDMASGNPHEFTIICNDAQGKDYFYIDNVAVWTNSTHRPTAGSNLRYICGGHNFTAGNETNMEEYVFISDDK